MDAGRLQSMSGQELDDAMESCNLHLVELLAKLGDELYGETRGDARFLHGREELYKAIGQGKARLDGLRAERDRRQGAGSQAGAGVCPSCGKPLESGFGFCAWCGMPVQEPSGAPGVGESTCQACGARVLPDDAFCMSCGTRLEAPQDAGDRAGHDAGQDADEGPTAPLHVPCPGCGFKNLPTARFCHGCGQGLR